jgi:glycine betaine/choline ABC-type transport system substrate-binding protein
MKNQNQTTMVSSLALFQQYANAMKQASAKKNSHSRTYSNLNHLAQQVVVAHGHVAPTF